MKYTTAYKCFIGLWLAGIVVIFLRFILPGLAEMGAVVIIVGLALAAIGFILGLVFFKCPHCGRHMPLRSGLPTKCPHCGKEL